MAASALRNPISADNKHHPIHRWVNWIAGFSWDFAGHAIDRYVPEGPGRRAALILEPFAGAGTTLVEAQRRGIRCLGFEINPFAYLAARTKLEAADVDLEALHATMHAYAQAMAEAETIVDSGDLLAAPTPRTAPPPGFRSRIPFFSPPVERKVLLSLDFVDAIPEVPIADLFRLAFATTMVRFSNYTYEPSLSSRPGAGKPLVDNAPVSAIILAKLDEMAEDVAAYRQELQQLSFRAPSEVRLGSFFDGATELPDGCVDLVLTSPPYLNNYHYVRNTRPHLFWLGYVSAPQDLRRYETESFGRFWQTVREAEPVPLGVELPGLAAQIEQLRATHPDKGIYGGAGWANYAATYFNDSVRLLRELRRLLRPGATAIVVVGNNVLQGIEFRVDDELVRLAQLLGLEGRTEIVRGTRVGSSIIGTGHPARRPRPPGGLMLPPLADRPGCS